MAELSPVINAWSQRGPILHPSSMTTGPPETGPSGHLIHGAISLCSPLPPSIFVSPAWNPKKSNMVEHTESHSINWEHDVSCDLSWVDMSRTCPNIHPSCEACRPCWVFRKIYIYYSSFVLYRSGAELLFQVYTFPNICLCFLKSFWNISLLSIHFVCSISWAKSW